MMADTPTGSNPDPGTSSEEGNSAAGGPETDRVAAASERWRQWRAQVDLDEYDSRWDAMAADGAEVHGEADLISSYPGRHILDAGCGMGRLAVELQKRGRTVIGVDNDDDMLAYARRRAPEMSWICADLANVDVRPEAEGSDGRSEAEPGQGSGFDIVAMIGNVLVFAQPDQRALIVNRLSSLLADGGRLITGCTYDNEFAAGLTLEDFDRWAATAGLVLEDRFATWDRDPYLGGNYAVSVHRLQSPQD